MNRADSQESASDGKLAIFRMVKGQPRSEPYVRARLTVESAG